MYREVKAFLPLSLYQLLTAPIKALLYLWYRGEQVLCILCGAGYRKFVPYRGRRNAGCVRCESLERHRMLWYYLQHQTDLLHRSSLRVLHVAPEHCLYKKFAELDHVEYYAGDLNPAMYKDIKAVMTLDIEKLSFDTGFFDLVLCSHVLEHVNDDRKAMAELYRVLKKGGLGVFLVPRDEELSTTYEDVSITTAQGRKKAFGQSDHVRLYGKDFADRLKKVSFRVTETDVVARTPKAHVMRYGFERHEMLYCCMK